MRILLMLLSFVMLHSGEHVKFCHFSTREDEQRPTDIHDSPYK
jgi:hypothetical protein